MDKAQLKIVADELGLGLARLLNYAFAGLLAVGVVYVAQCDRVLEGVNDRPELSALAAVVIGAGIYRTHRSAVIPLHHLFGCFLFRVWDCCNRTPATASASPTRWLRSLHVRPFNFILAYNVLRHDPEFMTERERDELDLKHAEFGLVVMAVEACVVIAVVKWINGLSWHGWGLMALFLWAASYPAPLQEHAIECRRWKGFERENRAVSTVLRRYDLLQ